MIHLPNIAHICGGHKLCGWAAMIRDWLLIFAVYVIAIGIIVATMFQFI